MSLTVPQVTDYLAGRLSGVFNITVCYFLFSLMKGQTECYLKDMKAALSRFVRRDPV